MVQIKQEGWASAKYWLYRHVDTVVSYVEENYHHAEKDRMLRKIMEENPVEGKKVIEDYMMPNRTKKRKIVQYLANRKGYQLVVMGAKGSGKSVFGGWAAEKVHSYSLHYWGSPRPVVYLRAKGERSRKRMPSWARSVAISDVVYSVDGELVVNHDALPYGALIIVDEAAVEFAARKSGYKEGITLSQFLPILRHGDWSLIVITQNTSLSDVNLVRLADALAFKKTGLLQEQTERSSIQAMMGMLRSRAEYETVVVNDDGLALNLRHGTPSFWSDEASKSYRGDEDAEPQYSEDTLAKRLLRTKRQGKVSA